MKNLLLILIGSIYLYSCQDETLNPLPDISHSGNLVKVKQYLPISTANNINLNTTQPIIKLYVEDPTNSIASFTLKGKIGPNVAIPSYSNNVVIKTISSFPDTLKVTTAELATALNIVPSQLASPSTNFKKFIFYGASTSKDGISLDLYEVAGTGFIDTSDKPVEYAPYKASKVIILRYVP